MQSQAPKPGTAATPRRPRRALVLAPYLLVPALAGCLSPEEAEQQADEQVYDILGIASKGVTGEAKTFEIGRKTDTLRDRLLAEGGAVELDLVDALDVAAENSRDFQTQKETLYLSALTLTGQQNEFAVRWGAAFVGEALGTGDDNVNGLVGADLSAAARSQGGTLVVGRFVNNYLRSLISGGGWNATQSLLSLSLTQPLLAGADPLVIREPLTQAERDVIYAVRSFERFREILAVNVVGSYLAVLQDQRNLVNERQNLARVSKSREQIEALWRADRRTVNDYGRAKQDELTAENGVINAENRLQASLDSLKFLLGLPVDAEIELTGDVLGNLEELGVASVDLSPERGIELALQRRYDYRTALDSVEDAARKTIVAADALKSIVDFSADAVVPINRDMPWLADWTQVAWRAGFDIDLALDRLPERNSYRASLIALDRAMRARDQLQDEIKADIRDELRSIDRRVANYQIQSVALELAKQRVDSSNELYEAGRAQALDVLDAQRDLLLAQLARTNALVDYALARLALLRDLEGIELDSKGLRLDLELPIPDSPLHHEDDRLATP